ncbi:DUF1513 domain-containing protein [Aliiroseovarius sp. YM-037]|uniref:DUF1513 domain-containing protein n=1 Tax=Aliiroseovarius sp. YM-037 TaxID=3341728 RepID=UPI003A80E98C
MRLDSTPPMGIDAMTTRRSFLGGVIAASAFPQVTWADAGGPSYLAAAREVDGKYALFGLSSVGADLFRIPLPDRGHAAAAHPTAPEAVAFARRPGSFALVIDCVRGRITHRLYAPDGRHFYGHGTFVEGGELLCTTENDIETGEGRIGFWSRSAGYERVGEISSGGIGPHDIKTLADGNTLVVANGGIRTHPNSGRDKLNLDTMRPNLSYLTIDGAIADQVELAPDLHQNSIRHLALGPNGVTAFAMQWQGDPADAPPLLGLHRRGESPRLLSATLPEQIAMEGYAGSIAIDSAGETVAITSPRGGRVHLFNTVDGFRTSLPRADVCGLAVATEGFMATDGLGGVSVIDAAQMKPLGRQSRSWDNHLIAV